jgi:hypothetical protein
MQQAVAGGRRLPSLFSSTDESFYSNLRCSVNSALSMSTLVEYEPLVDSTAIFLSQTAKLYAKPGARRYFSNWLQFYAIDVIGEMTYSKRHVFIEENKDIGGVIRYLGKLSVICSSKWSSEHHNTIEIDTLQGGPNSDSR